uniref:Uncharacterized protein n=1 Tax=Sinocyclocheilus rhinocerous TaxID=307959 RepID=A0A673MAQ2_9TELE
VDKMGDLSDFQTGQTMGTRLAGASVALTARPFGILGTTVYTIMTAYTKHDKTSSKQKMKQSDRNKASDRMPCCMLLLWFVRTKPQINMEEIRLQGADG